MLFRLPYKGAEDRDEGAVYSFDPKDPRFNGKHVPPSSMKVYAIRDQYDRPLVIKGQYETKDKQEVRILMQAGGMLSFDPLDAVKEKILTREEVAGLGFDVGEEVEAVEPEPLEMPTPRFEIMSKQKLLEWCLSQKPPINLDTRKKKDVLTAEVKAELEKRAKKE